MADHATPRATAAVSWGPDRIDLFTVDEDAGLVHRVFVSGTWSAPGWPSAIVRRSRRYVVAILAALVVFASPGALIARAT